MKQFKKTIFWLIALAAIFGSYLLIDNRVKEGERVEQAKLKLFPFEIDDVIEFWITAANTNIGVRVLRQNDGWHLTQPLNAKGDDEAIAKMLENIVNSRKDAILFENPDLPKLKELGLNEPAVEITFRTDNGLTTMQFGDKGPTLNVTYGRFKGSTAVYRVHSDVKNEASTSVYALRDKSTLLFDPLKLDRLEIVRNAKDTVEIVHDRGRWDMVSPIEVRADQKTVLEVLYAIKDTPVKAFIDEQPQDLERYGLKNPAITVTIAEQGNQQAQILRVGDRDRKRRGYFAIANTSRNVVLLTEELVKKLLAESGRWKEAP